MEKKNIDLKERTFKFANDIIGFVNLLESNKITSIVIYQIVKSSTSFGANYRAAKRSRSDKEFIAKLNIVLEEIDETLYWLEIIKEQKWVNDIQLEILIKEANELVSIFTSSLIKMNKKVS